MVTVLVTGCGGAVGLSVIKALRMGSDNLHLIGVDVDPCTTCFYLKSKEYLLNQTYVIRRAKNPKYIPEIIKISRKENVDVVWKAYTEGEET